MPRPDRTAPAADAANLERLRQVTARIRARAAEWGRTGAEDRSVVAERRRPEQGALPHWSDGPRLEDERDEEGDEQP